MTDKNYTEALLKRQTFERHGLEDACGLTREQTPIRPTETEATVWLLVVCVLGAVVFGNLALVALRMLGL